MLSSKIICYTNYEVFIEVNFYQNLFKFSFIQRFVTFSDDLFLPHDLYLISVNDYWIIASF